jgi:hypothetical protein
MNELIKGLSAQARSYANTCDETGGLIWFQMYDEKFAELLVAACLDVVVARMSLGTIEMCKQECKAVASEIKRTFRS